MKKNNSLKMAIKELNMLKSYRGPRLRPSVLIV
jgi:hypothetical protein